MSNETNPKINLHATRVLLGNKGLKIGRLRIIYIELMNEIMYERPPVATKFNKI
jgi:hypothetical protein